MVTGVESNRGGLNKERKPEIPGYLTAIVERHRSVFADPVGLPPGRGHEHAINLNEGSNPVGVRPYRYPQC